MNAIAARVVPVNVAPARTVPWRARTVLQASTRRPRRVARVRALGLEGDEQADLEVHDGPSKAMYAYPAEHFAFWRRELPGTDLV